MTVTVKSFFEEFNCLVDETWIDSDDGILPIVVSIINMWLVEQCSDNKSSLNQGKYIILGWTQIEKETLEKIKSIFDQTLLTGKTRANFINLLSDDDGIIFNELLEVYDLTWLTGFNYEIQNRKLINNISKESYLYKFIIELIKWNSAELVMQNLLEENHVNIDNSPLLWNSKEFKWFVDWFKFLVDRLINIWNPCYTDIHSWVAN